MFSKSVSRVALSASPRTTCAITATTPASTRTLSSRLSTGAKPNHQRRQSSSKASVPPGGPRGSEPTTDNAANTSAEDEKKSNNGRLSRRRSRDSSDANKTAVKARDEAFANIPAVPSTTHLQLGDVHTSSFFSLHRPISIDVPIPPVDNPRTISMFDSIFKPSPASTAHKPSDVIYATSSAVSALDSNARSKEEKDLRWEILQQSSPSAENANGNRRGQRGLNVVHLDGPPQHQSLEELVRSFRPFNVPPAPVPFNDVPESAPSQQRDGRQRLRDASEEDLEHTRNEENPSRTGAATQTYQPRPSRKVFTTTLTMTEVTSPSGEKTYSASASPIVERAARTSIQPRSLNGSQRPHARQPFLTRLYERQSSLEDFLEERAEREGREMWALSVKRQRKLKMKKHKYKKLMRRTRNLRRREGRN